ncbi:uncharacterized protein K460DRAFT_371935 [Cucurbitaria berberidis CBS 394.84]|uniref:Uncharacterized protein n=1 Tax=Cucurbitaria berberidis CBS 394.84 TaxID=1168544 RepID=A0A9P4G6L3_9PLEO|nr:uncharacterized protein K460DRAFT_371935 [Cucurbitaria berberidis CBS 394.84]KAF1839972.1 hypothetical protein K460DRAFT_371935 [Cucurbitaria berberidis CBS 394.84]
MFKTQVLRRNFSLFNRVPHSRIVRSAARDGHESVIIHRVHLRKPFFSKSRLVGAVAIAGATYGLGRYIGLEVEIEEVQEEQQPPTRSTGQIHNEDENSEPGQEVDEEEDEDYEDDALLFLPTGFSRPRPKTFYRGSDPEWQEFKKLATDRPRVEKIRGELATLIRDLAAKNPQYVARLGKIDTSKGKLWIEFKFPDGPPVEYERPGFELTEDLEWRKATRPVEDIHHQRLNKVLFPTEVANALYQDTKRKVEISWRDFRAYLGWEQKSEPDTVQQLVQRIGASPPSPSSRTVSTSTASPNPLPTSPVNETQQPTTSPSAAPADGLAKDLGFVLPDPKKLTLDLSQFRQDFRKAFKPYQMQSPRGTLLVLGLIEVYGDRARMTLNVTAAYDPKQGRYVSLKAGVWNLVEHRQAPRGGP